MALAAGVCFTDVAFGAVFFIEGRFDAEGFWEDLVFARLVPELPPYGVVTNIK